MDLVDYKRLLKDANLVETEGTIPGQVVLKPYALQIRNKLFEIALKNLLERGYELYEFPVLVPESFILKQKTFENFMSKVLWISESNKKLGERLFLKPSGEGVIYPVVKHWIRSYSDIPLRIISSSLFFRKGNRAVPLISGSGKPMFEGHAFFDNHMEAIDEITAVISIFKTLWEKIGIATLLIEFPVEGNKKVSDRTFGLMAFSGFERAVVLCAIYDQGQRYSKLLNISYVDSQNKKNLVYQTSYGFTDRPIGIMISQFSDERGIVIHPKLAPIIVAIICFVSKDSEKSTKNKALEIKQKLESHTITCKIFYSSGREPLYEMTEKMGIPLRILYGKREENTQKTEIFNRVTNKKQTIDVSDIVNIVENEISAIEETLLLKSKKLLEDSITVTNSIEGIQSNVKKRRITEFSWCGSPTCQKKLGKRSNGEILGTAVLPDGKKIEKGKCIICKKDAYKAYYGVRL